MRLYKFIDAEFGLKSLTERRLKISRLDEQNDPFELFADSQANRASRARVRRERAAIARNWGMLCFCADWRNPVVWGHYTEKHHGLCLGLEVDERDAHEVVYIDERLREEQLPTNMSPKDRPPDLAHMKFAAWHYEQEYRVWCRLDPNGPALQFAPFNARMRLTHVFLGARSKVTSPEVRTALGDLARGVEIVTTRIAFRTFEVVGQKDARFQR